MKNFNPFRTDSIKSFFPRSSNNDMETFASELLENIEDMFNWSYLHSDVLSICTSSTTSLSKGLGVYRAVVKYSSEIQ